MATKDAGDELDDLYNYTLGGTNPAGSASNTGDLSQLIKWLVAAITGTTDISGITADAAGSIVERIKYITDNTGIGLKKVSGAAAGLPATGAASISSNGSANTYGSYVEVRTASGNAIYIKGVWLAPTPGGRRYDLQFATGGSGSETAVNLLPINANIASGGINTYVPVFPLIAVAASTRIALRCLDNVGGGSMTAVLDTIDQANVVPA
jgi:hypothetical protein